MLTIRLVIGTVACLSLLLPLAASDLTVDEAAAGKGRPAEPSPARIASSAGGHLYFSQHGTRLTLQVDETSTFEVALPRQMTVRTAARQGGTVWISGRADPEEIRRMFVAEVTRDGTVAPLTTPAGRESPRSFPTFLAEDGSVVGMVWQEGKRPQDATIRAAAWLGTGWGPVEVISPPRGGEQTGLTAAVLADGSWLTVWAAVDSEDDLWWSRRSGDGWSAPGRVHADNEVPDVLPRLAPTEDGALLVWTRFDGNDYRLRLALLRHGSWSERPIPSGKGAVPAGFVELTAARGVLYSSVRPEAWGVVLLNDAGHTIDQHEAPRTTAEVPMVVERGADLLLRWPSGPGAAATDEVGLTPAAEPLP